MFFWIVPEEFIARGKRKGGGACGTMEFHMKGSGIVGVAEVEVGGL